MENYLCQNLIFLLIICLGNNVHFSVFLKCFYGIKVLKKTQAVMKKTTFGMVTKSIYTVHQQLQNEPCVIEQALLSWVT